MLPRERQGAFELTDEQVVVRRVVEATRNEIVAQRRIPIEQTSPS